MGFQGFEDLQDFFLGFYSLNPHSFSDLDQLAGGAHIDVAINAPGQIRRMGSTSTGTHGDGVASPGHHDDHHLHKMGDAHGWVRLPNVQWFWGGFP